MDYDEKMLDDMFKFMKAQNEAENTKKEHFTCPICGGNAIWCRAKINNHLHAGCDKCGFRIIE